MTMADEIIKLRKQNGWSQEELAEKLNVSRQSVSKWESEQSVSDIKRILALSELFGVSTDYLLKVEIPSETVPQAESTKESNADISQTETVQAVPVAAIPMQNPAAEFEMHHQQRILNKEDAQQTASP